MIIWDNFKLQNGNNTVTFSASGTITGLTTLSATSLNISGLATFNGAVNFKDNIACTYNASIRNITTTTLTVTDKATIASAALGAVSITGSLSAGSVTASLGSAHITNLSATNATVGIANISSLTVTGSANINGSLKTDLAEGSTYNGEEILTRTKQYGYWLKAYQGSGENWIEIRNYTNSTLTINSLQFSGNTWSSLSISGNGTWKDSDWWGWGSNDHPGNITLNYVDSAGETKVQTMAPAIWQDGTSFGNQDAQYPGQILSKTDSVLTVIYSSTNGNDVQAWRTYARSEGYTGTAFYFGANQTGSVVGYSITASTSIAGTYILTFRKP